MRTRYLLLFVMFAIVISCQRKSDENIVVEDVQLTETKQEEQEGMEPPPLPIVKEGSGIKISAHLIYNDDTRSDFDLLKDSTLVLWNTSIGAGDAIKPSEQLEVRMSGNIKDVQLLVRGTDTIFYKQQVAGETRNVAIRVKDTGCEPIMIEVSKKNEILFQKWIPFRCGE